MRFHSLPTAQLSTDTRRQREEPTLLEVFYDLVFAANYNVFSDNQEVTDVTRFKAYLGYFFLLWLTWLLVTLYDVRYVTDSIFSKAKSNLCRSWSLHILLTRPRKARLTRAIQLGVLVGFTIVAPKFNPTAQHMETMQAMSIILMVSRACLAVEYAAILRHVKDYKKSHTPLRLQMAVHAGAAIIYLGLNFGFREGVKNKVFVVWYIVSAAEALLTILLSNLCPVLSFTETHLIKRLTLLTVIIIGDGIIQVAREVVTIVKNPDAWDGVTIGLVTAAVATIYFVFLLYFDWLRDSFHLPAIRQQLWMSVHLPFHLSLILFTQGFTQFLIWSKIMDVLNTLSMGFGRAGHEWLVNATSHEVQNRLNDSTRAFFDSFPPKIPSTWVTIDDAISNVTLIPDAFWTELANYYQSHNANVFNTTDIQAAEVFSNVLQATMSSMANALFATFGMDLESEVTNKNPRLYDDIKGGGFQGEVQYETWDRYRLVFACTYIAAGATLFFMILLAVLARTTQLKTWPVTRLAIICCLALGTSLTSILFFHRDRVFTFLLSPWVLPTIALVWTATITLTHINGENVGRQVRKVRRRRLSVYSVDRSLPTADTLVPEAEQSWHKTRGEA
ncbi:hypothetical protein L249_0878 [Ophiocordyceps polyrhachis-furcata BCC 54312]|uniref:Low temperature requirement A n=1 Tax=Ophiocordyceps polyrhachis-furcata BCC 54312 TaxID=1330021 RepID=A0A367LE23_9HYPO|nr:hypothetical protein L249_0878 [Ophiocordyceps polyrhachis-furcata BCC 54312]